jgi:hypothetical protein
MRLLSFWLRLRCLYPVSNGRVALERGVIPRGVRSLTFFLRRSPELIDDNSGKRFIKRSVCVPLPAPGAPTSIILAALESAILYVGLTIIIGGTERRGG